MTSNMGSGQDTDAEIQTLKDAIDDVVDIYASLGKTQERIVTSIMKKPRTTDMFVAFMSILSEKLNGFTLLELKVKKLEESLKEALCTKKDMLKKQTHLEDQILDILACSTLRDMKTMLKKLVKDREIPTIARTKAAKKSTDQVQRDESILSTNVNDRTIKDRQLLEKADNITDLDITQPCDTVDNIKIEMNTEYDDEMNVSLEHDIEPTLDGITATVSKFKDDTDSDDTEDYDDPGADDPTADEDGADDGEFSLTNVKVEDEGEDVNMADQSDTTPADPSEAAPTEHKMENTVNGVTCPECGKFFSKVSNFKRHHRLLHRPFNVIFSCTFCNESFRRRDTKIRHEEIVHLKVKKHSCTLCENVFGTKDSLQGHMRNKHGSLKLKCNKCNKCFSFNHNFKIHIAVCGQATDVERVSCKICQKTFKNKKVLQGHQKEVHLNIGKLSTPPVVCEICGQCFTRKATQKRHVMRKHQD